MPFPVHLITEYESRYALLGAMASELADAFREHRCPVNPPRDQARAPGVMLFLNFLRDPDAVRPLLTPASGVAVIQYVVDHPLALDEAQIDAFAAAPNYRLVVCAPDAIHLAAQRFGIEPVLVRHGVPRSALVPAEQLAPGALAERPIDLVVMGSIASEAEIDALERRLPGELRTACRDVARVLVDHPGLPFEAAADAVLPSQNIRTGAWPLIAALWRTVTARVNRERRVGTVRALADLKPTVFGSEAWRELEDEGIAYAGQIGYADVATTLARSKVSIAWGPTQFAIGHSERLLLTMATGALAVSDDRLDLALHTPAPRSEGDVAGSAGPNTTRAPDPLVFTYNPADPDSVRQAVSGARSLDPDRVAAIARRARDHVEASHLWSHRVRDLARVANAALQPAPAAPRSLETRPASPARPATIAQTSRA